MTIVYGIKTCDTVRKTLAWLEQKGVEFTFYDFRVEPLPKKKLEHWAGVLGWEPLVNKKSTSWRSLSPEEQTAVKDKKSAVAALNKNNTLMKRPVIEHNDDLLVGFDPAKLSEVLGLKN